MNYKIILRKKVTKFIENCDKHIRLSFIEKIKIIAKNPIYAMRILDIKILEWKENHYRLRIWGYRFIYSINDSDIVILFSDANSRGDIYKRKKK